MRRPKGFVDFVCRRGHLEIQHPDALSVTCKLCSQDPTYHGTVEMKRADLFPNWSRTVKA